MAELTIEQKIDVLYEKAKQFNKQGDYVSLLESFLEAWNILPNPKEENSEAYHIVKYIVVASIKYHKLTVAKDWIIKIYNCGKNRYDSGEREYLHGKVEFALGSFAEAGRLFKVALEKSEGRYPDEKEYLKLISTLKKWMKI